MTKRFSKGFTIVELVIVVFMIGVAVSLATLFATGWVEDYRFSAATRVFINACTYARMRAIRGPISLDISQINSGGAGSTTFTLTPNGPVPFTYQGTPPTGSALLPKLPITTSDYVSLAGFNAPPFLNGNLFSVTAVNLGGSATNVGTNQWQVNLTFACQCCDETNPSQCLQWPSSPSPPQTTTTGKARVAACVKFVPTTRTVGSGSLYGTVTAGNSIQCQFEQDFFQIQVNGSTVTDTNSKSIVFDFAGATRNHTNYTVQISRMKGGVVVPNTVTPPVTFTVLPSGRIRLGE